MFRPSCGFDFSLPSHPWPSRQLKSLSDADLRSLFEEVGDKIDDGTYGRIGVFDAELTRARILRILEDRGSTGMGIGMGLGFSGFGLGVPGILPRMSPALSITQTAPMPNVTIQSIPAPQQNVTFQPGFVPQQNITIASAPAPVPLPPPAAVTVHHVALYGPYGDVIGSRPETEKEKDDREYAAWKAEHGAK